MTLRQRFTQWRCAFFGGHCYELILDHGRLSLRCLNCGRVTEGMTWAEDARVGAKVLRWRRRFRADQRREVMR